MAQFARVRDKLTRVDYLTKSDKNPREINNNNKKTYLIISYTNSHIYFLEVNFNNIKPTKLSLHFNI